MACDGLWKSFSNEQAVDYVTSTSRVKQQKTSIDLASDPLDYELCCTKIANEAVKKLTADNVTVIILSLHCD